MAAAMASIAPGSHGSALCPGQVPCAIETFRTGVRLGTLFYGRKLHLQLHVHKSSAVSATLPVSDGKSRSIVRVEASALDRWAAGAAAAALAAVLHMAAPASPVYASEFSVLSDGPPKESYVVDDAGVLSRVTKSDLKRLLADLEERKGYHINFVTVRKLTSKADAFEFADQLLERWYPTIEEGNDKGVVLLVTTQKEGAVTGGPAFTKAVGDNILEGVVSENLPVLATEEKYNEALYSTAKRLAAAIDGLPDPGGPKFQENKRESNFRTRQETEEKRGQFTTVVGGLLVIAFVVPMAQYYAYVSKK
ncbi:hypothetical protein O6H91_05G017700 [Diphasiastrum complanatum]|uniref:Uncharacterized protein n=2 Tax=Diphasiastrum complanatum TaxID=34168 RepID=A0ACC2DL05_DIPCM|nr:hypothetical protein O6H91_10G000100 [Diphasiastrum complanatum]KAJ7554967.1 hypothetical protein O6H91_05G017700 [Diphasiastrum complanatum]